MSLKALRPRTPLSVGSNHWCSFVEMGLKMGYGVEDIAAVSQCRVEQVRAYVSMLRKNGKFALWWPRGNEAAWGEAA